MIAIVFGGVIGGGDASPRFTVDSPPAGNGKAPPPRADAREFLLMPGGFFGEGEPIDVAVGVLYLASPEAAYVTGQTLHVNGGMAMI